MKTISRVANLKAQIVSEIRNGRLQPGEKIPSRHFYMKQFQCSRTSIDRAIAELAEAGTLETRQGAGTFVASAETSGHKIEYLYIVGNRRDGVTPDTEAAELAFQFREQFHCILCPAEKLNLTVNQMTAPGSAVIWVRPDYRQLMAMELLEQFRIPQLLLYRRFNGFDCITNDADSSIREGLEWLVPPEVPRLAYITRVQNINSPFIAERKLSFFRLMIKLGLSVPAEWFFEEEMNADHGFLRDVAERLFGSPEPCGCVYLDNAEWCREFLAAAAAAGAVPGRDFRLLVFDRPEAWKRIPGVAVLAQDHQSLLENIRFWLVCRGSEPFHKTFKTKLETMNNVR
ncbi:winged helix-turn-helix domain-containing protein [Victivallis vadensis]|jgi:gntR domain protein|uniref:winged helix-turn-helix domain-containing protein n=1 Tax=Victivallis vadensis TaxID=172901 RepID=UPI003AF43AF5